MEPIFKTAFLSLPRLKRKVMVRKSIEKAHGLMLSTNAAPPITESCFPRWPIGIIPAKPSTTIRSIVRHNPTNMVDQRFSKKWAKKVDIIFCAGRGNRTPLYCLEGSHSTDKLVPHVRHYSKTQCQSQLISV